MFKKKSSADKPIRDLCSGNHINSTSAFDGKMEDLKHIKRNFLHGERDSERERENTNVHGDLTV